MPLPQRYMNHCSSGALYMKFINFTPQCLVLFHSAFDSIYITLTENPRSVPDNSIEKFSMSRSGVCRRFGYRTICVKMYWSRWNCTIRQSAVCATHCALQQKKDIDSIYHWGYDLDWLGIQGESILLMSGQ